MSSIRKDINDIVSLFIKQIFLKYNIPENELD